MTYRKLLRRVSAAALSAAMIATSASSIAFAEDYVPEEILTDAAEESCEESDESMSPEAVAAQEEAFEDTSFEADMTEGTYEDLTILDEADLEAFYGQEEDGIILEETVSEEETEADGIIETAETEELFATEDGEDPEEYSGYVLMNIPYAEFYKNEISSVDAITSATLRGKARNMNVNGASYHQSEEAVTTEGIRGTTYPVKVSLEDLAKLGGTQVTDADSISYEMNVRGQMTTFTLEGAGVLQESPDYSYYILSKNPSSYKEVTVAEDGTVSFGAATGTPATVEGASGLLTLNARHANVEIATSGIEVTPADVSAVIVTIDGSNYALHHVVNIWRGTELGWNYGEIDALGKTMTNIRYYMKDGSIADYPVEIHINEDQSAADAVTKQLNRLNAEAGLEDKEAVDKAQEAYDVLTDEQKALVSKDAVDKLDKAKKSVEKAEKNAAEKAAAGPAVGTTLTSGKLKYAVTASGKKAVNGAAAVTGTVTVTGYANAGSKKSETKVTIPDQITVNGIRYNVTAIGSKAFKGSKKLKNVTVGANITTIGSKAFQNCKKLKKMVIKSSGLKSIGSKAFSKAGSSNYRKLTVKVPKAQLKVYRKLLKKAKLSARAKVKK